MRLVRQSCSLFFLGRFRREERKRVDASDIASQNELMRISTIKAGLVGVLDLFGDVDLDPWTAQLALGALRNEIDRLLGQVPKVLGPQFDSDGRVLVRCKLCRREGGMRLGKETTG